MAEQDAMATFDFNKLGGGGLFLKFQADHPVTIRFLTVDPIVRQQEFEDKMTGETNLSMKFAFIVYNLTEDVAQIVELPGGLMKRIGNYHKDPDFGADLRKMDIKIMPTGENKERRYDVQVLRHSGNETQLTAEQIKAAASIKLEEKVQDGYRLSKWEEMQKQATEARNRGDTPPVDTIENIGDELINLDDIPF